MNFTQEFEFTCIETSDQDQTETVKRFTSSGEDYMEIVNVFLNFLSSAYGYPITLKRLVDDTSLAYGYPYQDCSTLDDSPSP